MSSSAFKSILRFVLLLCGLLLPQGTAFAGGPRWVAGSSYFNAAAKGKPVHWKNGVLTYYLDQGVLSTLVYHTLANEFIEGAAAVWNNVPTAAVHLVEGGSLSEDVNGSNVVAGPNGISAPADIQSTSAKAVGVVYDVDGSVINAYFGAGASAASDCRDNGVITIVDNIAVDGTIAHALMLVNGLCAANTGQATVLQYQMVRAFGRILGLDWSQANESMFVGDQITSDGLSGWPIMHPVEYVCSFTGIGCMPNGTTLRYDDIAAISRMYPVTAANIASFTGKTLTAATTISVQGTIHFKSGQGMQGVNVVLRPLKPGTGVPDIRYTVTAVSGALFHGEASNPVNGSTDGQGNSRDQYGSDDPTLEGWFDLSGVPLPTGETIADYQLSFEPLNALYSQGYSVGPYTQGQVTPSGTLPVITLSGLVAGSVVNEDIVIQDSADDSPTADSGTEADPAKVSPSGEWTGRISGYGHTDWFLWPVRANRELTLEAMTVDETGKPSENKMRAVLGAWNGTDAVGALPVTATPQALNGDMAGLTTLSVSTVSQGQLRIGVADNRGDGRPDYLYRGRLLYADSVMPSRLSIHGGPMIISGVGFHANCVVTVNGVAAAVTGFTPTEITAIAPPANGATGTVVLMVKDPMTLAVAAIRDGLSYDAMGGDAIGILASPMGSVAVGVPMPFTVKALAADDATPAAGVSVTFAVTGGSALLGCGQASCTVLSGGDGVATMSVTAVNGSQAQVAASLTDGASVLTEFTGSTTPSIAAIAPDLYVAIGAPTSWSPQAQILQGGLPLAGQTVTWSMGSSVSASGKISVSGSNGIASQTVQIHPLESGADVPIHACLPGNAQCAAFQVYSVRPEEAQLVAVSGVGQVMSANTTPAPAILRVTDAAGHPMAGGAVTFYETLKQWTPECTSSRCPSAPVLKMQTVQATSGSDGLVTLSPLLETGIATRLFVTAVTGNAASLDFQIEEHP